MEPTDPVMDSPLGGGLDILLGIRIGSDVPKGSEMPQPGMPLGGHR